jgi:predicted XRE-type DNA-binding protein
MPTKKAAKIKVTRGSGNVFADMGLPNPDELLAKAQVLREITMIIKREKLNQTQAARRLGIDQPKVSALLNGKLSGFSMERLFHFLNRLGQDVNINIEPAVSDAGVHVMV